jgi:polyferredoxin
VAGLELGTKCACAYSHSGCLPLVLVAFRSFFFLFAFGVGKQSLAITIITRQNNLLFSSLSALGIRLVAVLLSIWIALLVTSDPCGRS